jgi:hypothetical protein
MDNLINNKKKNGYLQEKNCLVYFSVTNKLIKGVSRTFDIIQNCKDSFVIVF